MLKNLFGIIGLIGLTACAGVHGGATTLERTGEVAGTAGLNVAAKKCASLEGTREWQTCVAHYDGLYIKRNGTIVRSYNLSGDAPVQTGQIEKCNVKATLDSKTGTWSYSGCQAAHDMETLANE